MSVINGGVGRVEKEEMVSWAAGTARARLGNNKEHLVNPCDRPGTRVSGLSYIILTWLILIRIQ